MSRQESGLSPEMAERVRALLAELTLEEKALLTVGRDFWTTQPIDRLGIPSVWLSDGPTGLRKAAVPTDVGFGEGIAATAFPTESALASSWDVELLAEVGRAVGVEAQANGVQCVLAPGVNLKRSPLGGRNFEYFSEDPVLSGEMAAAYIGGLQGQGVGASLKHFAANEQETARMYTSSVVDERTLREVYLRAFEIAVEKSAPWTVMAAYNRLNGVYCTENRRLLHDILRREWGFSGIVVSDWGAVNDRADGIEAGLHLQMPAAPTVESVVAAVRGGRLSEVRLDEVVGELLTFILTADAARRSGVSFDPDAHHQLARRAAAESAVLLKNERVKNERGVLPIDPSAVTGIAVIGGFARAPRYQGSGSSQVTPTRLDNALDELRRSLGVGRVAFAEGYGPGQEPDAALIDEARELAAHADAAVVFVGLPASSESEGVDRRTLDLPAAHDALVEAVAEAQPNTVVVLTNGSAVAMPWIERVPAVLEGWLGGQAGAGAVVDILLGRVSPSGKLAETFPRRLEDTPAYLSFPGEAGECQYSEGLYTGYRWYDARDVEPLFPFGHGLSYTRFEYSDLKVNQPALRDVDTLRVSLKVRNAGGMAAREVVQLYVRERAPRLRRPDKELRAFAKVSLEPGEETEVSFQLRERDFAFYDPEAGAWTTTSGVFDLLVAASSRDIRLATSVTLESTKPLSLLVTAQSPVRKWLQHPVGQQHLAPRMRAHFGALLGAGGEDQPELLESFYDMPLAKGVVFGFLSEEDLARLVELASQQGGPAS